MSKYQFQTYVIYMLHIKKAFTRGQFEDLLTKQQPRLERRLYLFGEKWLHFKKRKRGVSRIKPSHDGIQCWFGKTQASNLHTTESSAGLMKHNAIHVYCFRVTHTALKVQRIPIVSTHELSFFANVFACFQ